MSDDLDWAMHSGVEIGKLLADLNQRVDNIWRAGHLSPTTRYLALRARESANKLSKELTALAYQCRSSS